MPVENQSAPSSTAQPNTPLGLVMPCAACGERSDVGFTSNLKPETSFGICFACLKKAFVKLVA